jgi:hypothetical protein
MKQVCRHCSTMFIVDVGLVDVVDPTKEEDRQGSNPAT